MRIAIIGAGPAGITAAYQLSKEIKGIDLYEASPSVGGLAKTIDLWNQRVDLGPHRFFSNDIKVNSLWLEVMGKDYEMVNRLTRIYYKNNFFYYPLKPFNALKNLGVFEASRCVLSYMAQRIVPAKNDDSFQGWVTEKFGKRLFEIFFKTYSQKLWGISCKELDADFAAQRIKKLSLFEAIKNSVFGSSGNKHKTLVDQFAYPTKGSGVVYERMQEAISKNGSFVHLNTSIKRVLTKDSKAYAIELQDGTIKEYDHIISTMPLSTMVLRLPDVPEEIKNNALNLKFRNTILVYLKVEHNDLFPDNWLYIHSSELKMGRLTNFRNWSYGLHEEEKGSILTLEYWCYDEDEFWKWRDEDLIKLAKEELVTTGLTKGATISNGFAFRIPKCYPVYNKGYKENLKPVENYLSTIENLSVIGRYGAFKYNNQDHSILMGIMAAENILNNVGHDLWEINTDYENYQEEAIITETGLEIQK
mgnify:CR=1 FL=1